jgi:hypothetical protein
MIMDTASGRGGNKAGERDKSFLMVVATWGSAKLFNSWLLLKNRQGKSALSAGSRSPSMSTP